MSEENREWKYDQEHHELSGEMPHELIMDLKDLDFNDLSPEIQLEIRVFDVLYMHVMEDEIVTHQEKQELLTKSYEIAKFIELEHGKASQDNTTGIVVGVLVAIGATIGLSQLFKS